MHRTVLAPAKINLCLHVLAKRPDGYHDLAMLMQRVSLYDRIDIRLTRESGVTVICEGVCLDAGEDNIAARAARIMLDLANSSQGVEIVIDKQIPVAAGLGGGSSDAAAVLTTVNDLLSLGLSTEELMRRGAALGADVPFFVFGQTAWATGIGDRLQKVVGVPQAWYVLVNPGFAVSTPWVYQSLGLTSVRDAIRLPEFSGGAGEITGVLHNDLEPVTVGRYPLLAEIKQELLDLGAQGSLMSGSGPTVFGVFDRKDRAQRACEALRERSGWRVFLTEPV